jgi:hypothetical protein
VRHIRRDDLRALIDADAVTLIEALPEPQYDAEHLPGAVNLVPDRGHVVLRAVVWPHHAGVLPYAHDDHPIHPAVRAGRDH